MYCIYRNIIGCSSTVVEDWDFIYTRHDHDRELLDFAMGSDGKSQTPEKIPAELFFGKMPKFGVTKARP